jgi:hypothetical protein
MPKAIAVYCSSRLDINPIYIDAAEQLGKEMALRGDTLIYGGGSVGLMGVIAKAVHAHGGKVIGIIPEILNSIEIAYQPADELIITRDMRERKALMDQRSEAIITLPGGFGTLEELSEMLTHKHLGYHSKPIVILNINGFYDPMLRLFDHFYSENFANLNFKNSYFTATTVAEALDYIDLYHP